MCVYVPEDYHRLVASQRHTPPADEWDTHQPSGSLAGALVDSDNADILRTRAEPNGEPGVSATIGLGRRMTTINTFEDFLKLLDEHADITD